MTRRTVRVVRVPRPLSCLFATFFFGLIGCTILIGIGVPLVTFGLVSLPFLSPTGSVPFTSNIEATLLARLGIELRELDGNASRFDPYAGLAQVQAFAGEDAELIEIKAFGVRNDGTLDLLASYRPAPDAQYTFIRRLAEPPPNAPPPGAGGPVDGVWHQMIKVRVYRPGEARHVSSTGSGGNIQVDYRNKGLEKETRDPVRAKLPGEAIAPPNCSLVGLWQQALTRGATPDAVAEITYSASGYVFAIRGSSVNLRLGANCAPRS